MIGRLCIAGMLCGVAVAQVQSISGTVTDAVTGGPISQARVMLMSTQKPAMVLTDAGGSFTFGGVPPGQYSMIADRLGYAALDGKAMKTVVVEPNKNPVRLEMQLLPTVSIAGTVVDEDGVPVASASINILRQGVSEGRKRVQTIQMVSTDDLGEFHTTGLLAGRYLACISASASSYLIRHHLAYMGMCFPNAPDPQSAEWIELRAGNQRALDFHLTILPTIRVTGSLAGTVTGQAGTNSLSVQRLDNGWLPQNIQANVKMNESRTTFEIPALTPGNYLLSANSGTLRAIRVVHAGREDLMNVQMALREDLNISGTVRMDGAPPNQGRNSIQVEMDGPVTIYAAANGTFSAPIRMPGEFPVRVVAPPNWTVQSVMEGGFDRRDRNLTIGEEGSPGPIEVVLKQGGGALDISIDQALRPQEPPLKIVILRRSGTGDEWVEVGQPKLARVFSSYGIGGHMPIQMTFAPPPSIGANTPFHVPDLTPADYLVFAWSSGEEVEYLNPEWILSYRSFGQAVTVRDGETTKVNLKPVKLK